jgi:excisionase family DNA binding protein
MTYRATPFTKIPVGPQLSGPLGSPQWNKKQSQNPISVSVRTATRLSGLGRTRVYEAIARGEIASIRIGRRRLINFASLKTFLTARDSTHDPE